MRRLLVSIATASIATTVAGATVTMLCACAKPKPEGNSSPTANPNVVIAQVVAGKDLTCARTNAGDVYCWGDDAFSSSSMSAVSLPPPTRTRPVLVAGLKGATAIDVGSTVGCAVDGAGAVSCWRDRTADQTGPAPALSAQPTGIAEALDVSLGIASVSRACVRKRDQTVACVTIDRGTLDRTPTPVADLEGVEAFSSGDVISCATRKGGKLVCWGAGLFGLKPLEDALAAPPVLEGVTNVAAGSAFACAITNDGTVKCFGSERASPPPLKAKLVRAGVAHACLLDPQNIVHCWGDNRFGQLGSSEADGTVREVRDAVDVAVGEWHTCALEKGGRVKCWGRNERGQVGIGKRSTEERTPSDVTFP